MNLQKYSFNPRVDQLVVHAPKSTKKPHSRLGVFHIRAHNRPFESRPANVANSIFWISELISKSIAIASFNRKTDTVAYGECEEVQQYGHHAL